ncbi:MAG: hypothetical protein ABIN91_06430 [Mucilaginibacter sp.]|uniref:hypothetical protein n=1 Tax=Mucilaginibacter sp. TaxID=1882438 RepID=UPI003267EABB
MHIILFILFQFLPAVATQQQPIKTTVTKQEEKAMHLIATLPEVIKFNTYVVERSGRPLVIVVDNDPTKTNPFYKVSVSEDVGERLRTRYWFYVDAKTYAISYWDVANDKIIPLKTWRKNGSKM